MEDNLKERLESLQRELEQMRSANQELNERVLELYALYNVSRTLSMSLQLGELFELTMNAIGESMRLDQFCLMLIDEDTGELVIQASHGMPRDIGKSGLVCSRQAVSWQVAKKAEPVVIDDASAAKECFYFEGSELATGSYLGVPLIRKSGSVVGVLNAHKPSSEGFSQSDVRLFQAVASHVAVAIDNALAFKQTREMSHRDDLTNLYNRRYFFERFDRELYRAARYGHPLSLLMVDIDHFKRLNDSHGHLVGDEVLKKLARLLESRLRKADVVARYGGEEFLLLLPETDRQGAACVASKIRGKVEKTEFGQDGGPSIGITVTIGLSSFPDDSDKAGTLLDLADKTLYYGKAKGRNQVCAELPDSGEDTGQA